MKHARRFAALIAALLLLFACALADTARVYPDADGSFLLLRQDDQTLLIGSGGEAAVRRLAEASGLPGVDRVLVLCDHPTHIESAQRHGVAAGYRHGDARCAAARGNGIRAVYHRHGQDRSKRNLLRLRWESSLPNARCNAAICAEPQHQKVSHAHLLQRETNERKEPAGLRRHARGNHSARIRALQALQAVKS